MGIGNMEFLFFFFQADDGIRDKLVTGVQTCALPIYARWRQAAGFDIGAKPDAAQLAARIDRKSVVEGKSVDLGGRRFIKKKTKTARPAQRRETHRHVKKQSLHVEPRAE